MQNRAKDTTTEATEAAEEDATIEAKATATAQSDIETDAEVNANTKVNIGAMKNNWTPRFKEFIQRKPKTLAFKIPFAYFVIILLTVAFSALVLNRISESDAQRKINEASLQTITSIETNVNLMIENVNNYSKMIFSDPNLQNLLRQGNVYSNLQTQSKVSAYLTNLMQAVPIIDSVYIYDNSGHRFSVGTQEWPTFMEANVKEAPWYEQALKHNGRYLLRLNGGNNDSGVSATGDKDGQEVVSFIRLIRDLDDTSPLGFLVMNIKGKSIAQAYANLSAPDSFQVAILDEHQRVIATNATDGKKVVPAVSGESISVASGQEGMHEMLEANQAKLKQTFQEQSFGFITLQSGGQEYAVTYRSSGDDQWKFISMSPYQATDTRNKSMVMLALILLAVNGTVFFVSSFIISRSVIKPIHKLLRSMQKAPSGNFRKVTVELNSYEFAQLYGGYNQMIEQIDQMLKRIIQEQQTIRRAELNTLQAQIKPHFLYNTLDSITSLAMSGMNDKVCELLEALGSYYRLSVSKGRELITLHEEVEIVRNYLTIQQVRYPGVFEVQYDIAPDCERVMIPKLVLQPLVENSLYHGIRPKSSPGTIRIQARRSKEGVLLTITDDGVGMSEEEVQQVQRTEMNRSNRSNPSNSSNTSNPTYNAKHNPSFGLWGTMERLRIFYDREDGLKLQSEVGKGTTIIITIPKGADESWN
ncbi:integral membrane sensor signal transduction histidine kinase [Paenibacillus sp. FSL R5-192]|uniref:cache domain-containing sensor histidine kinase n=1 Tax=Paenibacillus sp. FSL R5-192 TaxID=1226754 RepID=UPI0003E1C7F1|nr:sensor histidine kinase [Paenibacillus sp. FSL R5-192]ETT29665.1 integral membrane sensor signal transduction histidine kinase [Paenibacillus sp. FSL R5-192]